MDKRGIPPLCQDTGMAVVFLELGQDVNIVGGDLYEAVQEGVRRAYERGYLRKSVVDRPFSVRTNTRDNTPAVIHTTVVPGEKLKITALSKGFDSENMSRLAMLTPAKGRPGVIDFVVRCVDEAGVTLSARHRRCGNRGGPRKSACCWPNRRFSAG